MSVDTLRLFVSRVQSQLALAPDLFHSCMQAICNNAWKLTCLIAHVPFSTAWGAYRYLSEPGTDGSLAAGRGRWLASGYQKLDKFCRK